MVTRLRELYLILRKMSVFVSRAGTLMVCAVVSGFGLALPNRHCFEMFYLAVLTFLANSHRSQLRFRWLGLASLQKL